MVNLIILVIDKVDDLLFAVAIDAALTPGDRTEADAVGAVSDPALAPVEMEALPDIRVGVARIPASRVVLSHAVYILIERVSLRPVLARIL